MPAKHFVHALNVYALLAIGLAAACSDATGPENFKAIQGQLRPGIYPTIVIPTDGGDFSKVEVHLRRVNVQAGIVSYQGELTYRSDLVTIGRAESPAGITGSWNEPVPGRLRFAGAALDGINHETVVTFYVKSTRSVKPSDFALNIEEIIAADQFKNVTSLIVVP